MSPGGARTEASPAIVQESVEWTWPGTTPGPEEGPMALLSFRKKAGLPAADDVLPGRAEPIDVPERHFVTRRPITPPFPEGLEQAVFGLGCFWGAERKFWQTAGVWTTAVGYAGGVTPNPTYEEVCSGLTGHAEVVLVVFDPKAVTYDALLRVF